jgi:hypothetical protein
MDLLINKKAVFVRAVFEGVLFMNKRKMIVMFAAAAAALAAARAYFRAKRAGIPGRDSFGGSEKDRRHAARH